MRRWWFRAHPKHMSKPVAMKIKLKNYLLCSRRKLGLEADFSTSTHVSLETSEKLSIVLLVYEEYRFFMKPV